MQDTQKKKNNQPPKSANLTTTSNSCSKLKDIQEKGKTQLKNMVQKRREIYD